MINVVVVAILVLAIFPYSRKWDVSTLQVCGKIGKTRPRIDQDFLPMKIGRHQKVQTTIYRLLEAYDWLVNKISPKWIWCTNWIGKPPAHLKLQTHSQNHAKTLCKRLTFCLWRNCVLVICEFFFSNYWKTLTKWEKIHVATNNFGWLINRWGDQIKP